jgi:hypothetical protein
MLGEIRELFFMFSSAHAKPNMKRNLYMKNVNLILGFEEVDLFVITQRECEEEAFPHQAAKEER